jgi:hypothetical protein
MFIAVATALLVTSSPFPFEVSRGFAIEPVAEYLFKDRIDDDKAVGGARVFFFQPDVSDAVITAEFQFLTATSFQKPKDALGNSRLVMNTDYFCEAGLGFYEIYNPMVFRVSAGGGAELRKEGSPDLYIRAGLGRYFFPRFGLFLDLGSRLIFRDDKLSSPINLGASLQFIF